MVFSAPADGASCQLSSILPLLARSPSALGSPRSSLKFKGANALPSWGSSVVAVEGDEPVGAAVGVAVDWERAGEDATAEGGCFSDGSDGSDGDGVWDQAASATAAAEPGA